jgi:hypothetical protein
MAIPQAVYRRAPKIASNSSLVDYPEGRHVSKPRALQDGRTTALDSFVTLDLESHTWSEPTSEQSAPCSGEPATSNEQTTSDPSRPERTTKRESRFSSLFITLLAVSPMAIEYDAADQQTMEAAKRASISATQSESSKKAYTHPTNGVTPPEIRKTKWRRLKYEIGLKMRITGRGAAKDRWKWTQAEDMELEILRAEERQIYTPIEGQSSTWS